MKSCFSKVCSQPSPETLQKALCFLRVSIGILGIGHGYPKLVGGVEQWTFLGSAMTNLGIYAWPAFWGLLAACAEFFGGVAYILGLGTRIASFFLIGTMIVALRMHLHNGDPFSVYSFAITLLVVFVTFLVIGSGRFSLDHYLLNRKR